MVDRSSLPYDENVSQVAELVKIAHAVNVSVEAELGHVGMGDNYAHDGNNALTVPSEAVEYIKATGVDALAVAIGSAHGVYKGTPKLRFELLEQLRDAVSVPLVLHGGSGTGDENLMRACQSGINKVNLCYDLLRAAVDSLTAEDISGTRAYDMFPLLARGWKSKIQHYIKLFGGDGKAWKETNYTTQKFTMTSIDGNEAK
jgi:fructose-bisphosphate aldolase class II